jgi:hypothetical protein
LLVATALLGPLGVGKLFPAARNLATAIFD